ncbi:hypothetical protein Krac_0673 [Ktedonobacter racemifer DSM 44963]|uniref:Uncharacterized protein n=1 Tax=Ktedonobacter racemifer DSM 44963 TaxID=485913 RepID=D6U8A8_KTERA|nr:hypothetical protein Krac_0673 [Ktedonobacter racemifer DSM 44963]
MELGSLSAHHEKTTRGLCRLVHGSHLLWQGSLVQGRSEEEKVFARIPSRLDIHAYRRQYAQALYQQLSGLPLPPATGRLPRGILDEEAVLAVSRALGHNRRDVVLTYYLR